MGICSAVCRFVGMGFPFIDMLNSVVDGASLAFMITLAILSAMAILLLPETNGQELPETVDECYLLAQGKLHKMGTLKTAAKIVRELVLQYSIVNIVLNYKSAGKTIH